MGQREPLRAQLTRSSTLETAYSTLLDVGTPWLATSSSTPSSLVSDEVVEAVPAILRRNMDMVWTRPTERIDDESMIAILWMTD